MDTLNISNIQTQNDITNDLLGYSFKNCVCTLEPINDTTSNVDQLITCLLSILGVKMYKYPYKIIFNGDTTICLWIDGSKTFVKRHGDDANDYAFSATLCILKKHLGNGATAKMHGIFEAIDAVEKSEATNKVIKLKSNGNVEGHN